MKICAVFVLAVALVLVAAPSGGEAKMSRKCLFRCMFSMDCRTNRGSYEVDGTCGLVSLVRIVALVKLVALVGLVGPLWDLWGLWHLWS